MFPNSSNLLFSDINFFRKDLFTGDFSNSFTWNKGLSLYIDKIIPGKPAPLPKSDNSPGFLKFINFITSNDSQVNAAAVINNKDPQSRENYIQALENCEYSINLNPTNPEGYICKGAALIHLGDYQESVLALNMAIDLDPYGIWGYGNRAISYELMGLSDKSNLDLMRI